MKCYPNISCLTENWRKFVQVCCNNYCNDCFSPQSHRNEDSFPRTFQARNRFQRNLSLRIDVHRNRNTTSLAERRHLAVQNLTVKYVFSKVSFWKQQRYWNFGLIIKGYYIAARRYTKVLFECFQHGKRNFLSPSVHVIFFL